jgi:type VI secretion system protein ImpG
MKPKQHEDLLRYYKNELTYLRQMGSEFARHYPKVAARLELQEGECPDPHVERLLESFAFLTARLQHNIHGEFSEITSALLGVLYPQFTNPIPSMAVARFDVDPKQPLTSGSLIRRHTALFADTPQGVSCRFRTCYPVTLWPLKVVSAGFEDTGGLDFLDSMPEVSSVLRIKLRCTQGTLGELGAAGRAEPGGGGDGGPGEQRFGSLRFYLNGDQTKVSRLYELLFVHLRGVAVMPEEGTQPFHLPLGSVREVGFGLDEEVLPFPSNSHPAYRLLLEYFTFPEKYHFFGLDNLERFLDPSRLDPEQLKAHQSQTTLDLLFMFDRMPGDAAVSTDTFCLGCTPIINLFPKTTEPVRLDHASVEYRLVPDKRRERSTEIHSVLAVSAASNAGDTTKNFEPFYSYSHAMQGRDHKSFWHMRRLPSEQRDVPGTEVYLSFLDLDYAPHRPPVQTVYAHTLCTNRELATQLGAGAVLQTDEEAPPCTITCLRKPTWPSSLPQRGQSPWQLISHLSLNYLSLSEGRESLAALREMLRLYCPPDNLSMQDQITGISHMTTSKVTRRVGDNAWRGFCRGTEVRLEFDQGSYVGGSAFLLGAVLNRFFALYASVNSFTELVIQSKQREGEWKRWPPMTGEKGIL